MDLQPLHRKHWTYSAHGEGRQAIRLTINTIANTIRIFREKVQNIRYDFSSHSVPFFPKPEQRAHVDHIAGKCL